MGIMNLEASKRFAVAFSQPASDDVALADGLELVTIRAASQMCRVSLATVDQWIVSGLWPLPRTACRKTFFYKQSDIEGWLATGRWPVGVRFHARLR